VSAPRPECEVLLAVSAKPSGYQLLRPAQFDGRTRLVYRPPRHVLLQIHAHGAYPACFSATTPARL
jgi:hypothetical protein